MAGIPKLPGFTFSDPTLTKFHLSQTFNLCNGYKLPKNNFRGIGGREIDSNSVKHLSKQDVTRFDPSLTYGRTKSQALPQFTPHYVLYDQKCLTFKAFFKQAVVESANEFYRVRHVNIIYFLEDDTITVMEPKTPNSGIDQGRLIRRSKIPKNDMGAYWHWKDLNVGKDILFNGVVFHTVDCDLFTREYMASQGLVMADPEEMPVDPYTFNRQQLQARGSVTKTGRCDDKLRRFLEYDGKVLNQRYTDTPATYPAIYLEVSDAEITEFYQPKDFQIGETIFVLGRDILLYDCDKFTRDYFRKALCIEQKPAIDISVPTSPPTPAQVPPHNGLGSLEDSLQNTLTFLPKPPKKDVMRQLLNANKYLRYEMVMDAVHPEDTIRRFLLSYSLADSTCSIQEPPIKNSGIIGGKYLRSTLLVKPGSDPLNPDYYTPADFYIGAIITVFQQRFKIIGADLYVYRYMTANSNKFPCEVIQSIRNYMFNKGYLKDDVEDQVKDNLETERQWDLDTKGDGQRQTEMEKCLQRQGVDEGYDPEYEKNTMDRIREEYEESVKHKSKIQPYGVKPVNMECAYPVNIGDVKSTKCTEEAAAQYTSYTPKHVDTPEEIIAKHYTRVLKDHRAICDGSHPVECIEPPSSDQDLCRESQRQLEPKPIMVSPPDIPPQECKIKTVTFAEDPDRCNKNRLDLCELNLEKTHCDCTKYQREC
nr:EF-hand domain-containing protein 1-like [Leptinotarsa decemlineata]